MENEKVVNIHPITILELNKLLDILKKNEEYTAEIENISFDYINIVEDEYGKREIFVIQREVEDNGR